MMQDIYCEILRALEKKERAALATLITRVGSAPRAVGAKYLVKEDGTSWGSIGGGCVEAEVWQRAQEVIEKGEGIVLHFNLTAEQLAEGGLICGGNIEIFLEPLERGILKDLSRSGEDQTKRRIGYFGHPDFYGCLHFPEKPDLRSWSRPAGEKIGYLT